MSWTLTLKQKDAPGVGAHFIFSFKVQNYAGLIQKVRFHLKKKVLFLPGISLCQEAQGSNKVCQGSKCASVNIMTVSAKIK